MKSHDIAGKGTDTLNFKGYWKTFAPAGESFVTLIDIRSAATYAAFTWSIRDTGPSDSIARQRLFAKKQLRAMCCENEEWLLEVKGQSLYHL